MILNLIETRKTSIYSPPYTHHTHQQHENTFDLFFNLQVNRSPYFQKLEVGNPAFYAGLYCIVSIVEGRPHSLTSLTFAAYEVTDMIAMLRFENA